jgi:hypothetical protein
MDQNLPLQFPLHLRLWPKPTVVTRRLPDKTVLLDQITGECYELNRVGAEVWSLLNGERTLEEICALLLPMLGAPEGGLVEDVRSFAADLRAAGLAEQSP